MKPRQCPVPSAAVEVLVDAVVLPDAAVAANNDTNADAASDWESPASGNIVVFVSSLVWTLCFSFQLSRGDGGYGVSESPWMNIAAMVGQGDNPIISLSLFVSFQLLRSLATEVPSIMELTRRRPVVGVIGSCICDSLR